MERAPQTLIVDASVVAKWFVPEADSDKALRLRNRHIEGSLNLMAPDLLLYEIANALVYHPEIMDEDIREDMEALFTVDIELVSPSSELMASIAEGARHRDISVYDSSYLALAEVVATNLVTADRRLYEKVKHTGQMLLLDELDRKWTV
jgi:predicted nucleic acid-binding protein